MAAKPLPTEDSPPLVAFERRSGALRRRADIVEARKRAFLRLASHELRTPLNAIVGFSEIIAGELYGPLGAPQYKEYAEHVRSSGYRLLRLINQVIDIARLDGGVADLDIRSEALDEAIHEAIETVKAEAALHSTVFEVDCGMAPQVMADARGLRVALVNLLQTAAGRSPEGAAVKLTVRRVLSRVEIEVADQGETAPMDHLARMLDPFENANGGLPALDGEGLGLAIAKLQCVAMGGGLRLQTPAGGGLVATAHLPAA
ncbi:MAG: histidine kinase [Caulobacteraceae bacterium]|nr:histidine kinase [Caulobacteraceae bacterium]